ncbi:hypothetical protein WJX84_002029 [Apatococcus fuscideae]|uniref:Uncharacterized protein n=1 Tax=Apatococcus fuscideae TaxID=2026836 RepID=A0AAW1SAV4_9CHLO
MPQAASTSAAPEPVDVPGELLVKVENKAPVHDAFSFEFIADKLQAAADYLLQYSLHPAVPGAPIIMAGSRLSVKPGQPSKFALEGEGRLAAATKQLMLGETLPPLLLILTDPFGNRIQHLEEGLGKVQVSVQRAEAMSPGVVSNLDIQVSSAQDVSEGCARIIDLQVLGDSDVQSGLQLFGPSQAACGASPQMQQPVSEGEIPTAEVVIGFSAEEMAPETLKLRLRPGAPHSLQLGADAPFVLQMSEDAAEMMTQMPPDSHGPVAAVVSQAQLATFTVQSKDLWGNRTCTTDDMTARVLVECEALEPSRSWFTVGADGTATVQGLKAVMPVGAAAGPSKLSMSLVCEATTEGCQAALAAAGDCPVLTCGVTVEPSHAPVTLVILLGDDELQARVEGEGMLTCLEGIPAGQVIDELGFYCQDEAGRPVGGALKGRLTFSWGRSTKKVTLQDETIVQLPPLQAPQQVGEECAHFLRFAAEGGIQVEMQLTVLVVPGPPADWSLTFPDKPGRPAGAVICGQPFSLEVEALDMYRNRCRGGKTGDLPMPILEPTSGQPLEFDRNAWEQQWATQASEEMNAAQMSIVGRPGPVTIAYMLRAASASRKHSMEDATTTLHLASSNAVTAITITPGLPPAGQAAEAGSTPTFRVGIVTEDGEALPEQVALDGLSLQLCPPGGGRADSISVPFLGNMAADGTSFSFSSPKLTGAGRYTVAAVFEETRPELVRAIGKRDAVMRSAALELHVRPGAPATLLMLDQEMGSMRLAAGNGADAEVRQLLPQAVLQLADRHGNAVATAGVAMAARLAWPARSSQRRSQAAPPGAELPILHGCSLPDASVQVETDTAGQAHFRDISIAQGSGCSGNAEACGGAACRALECELVFEARTSGNAMDADELELPVWRCSVLFSDDSSHFAALQALNSQHRQAVASRDTLQQQLHDQAQRVRDAESAAEQAASAVQQCHRDLDGAAPASIEAVQAELQRVQEARQELARAEPVEAQYGARERCSAQQGAMTAALDDCLESEEPGLVGVLAQLGTVDDHRLARILAAHYRSLLAVLIVAGEKTRQTLSRRLQSANRPQPDILCLTHSQPFRGPGGEAPGMENCQGQARSLMEAASIGSDPPLNMPLPHTRVMMGTNKDWSSVPLGPSDWPQGCLGYACNLVRPVIQGHRAAVLYPLLGSTLVFDTLPHAAQYRELATQALRTGTGDIVTLDLRKITSKGITVGTSFHVAELAQAPCRFGSTTADAHLTQVNLAQHQELALERLVEALQDQQSAGVALEIAQQKQQELISSCREQLQAAEQQIADIDLQLGTSQASPGTISTFILADATMADGNGQCCGPMAS